MKKLVAFAALALFAAPPVLAAETPDFIAAAIAASQRSEKDRERDAKDKPAELLTFAGIHPGMAVADIFGGGGYWTELMARSVGKDGRVTLVNNSPYVEFAKDDLKTRFVEGRLINARPRTVESCDLKLGKSAYDLVLIFMSYHDLYYVDEAGGWPAIDAAQFLGQLHAALKPGGILLIVDHAAAAGTGKTKAGDLHRIEESFAQADIEGHGFRLEKTWDGYRHSDDDKSKQVFDPAVRGKTDRFTHLYRKR
ncbi:MAG: class I SAM-dependent methyltransferase [Steroidobacteraceae bacterium]